MIKKTTMPDIFYLIAKWWKQIVAIVFVSLGAVALVLFTQKEYYLSVSTALPGNSLNADKSRIFNDNIQSLYPSIGTPDELDKIVGTAQLDTVYIAITREFDLVTHYAIKERSSARLAKAAVLLKKNTSVLKSDYGELKVKVWDTDRIMAASLSNAIMSALEKIHRDIQNESNLIALQTLRAGQQKIQSRIDSILVFLRNTAITEANGQQMTDRQKVLMQQAQQYEKLIGEYQLIIDSNPAVLVVVEKARSATWPDKPKRLQILVATAFLSLVFALLLTLLLERRKNGKK